MSDTIELTVDTREVEAALIALPRKLRGAIMAKALQLAGDVMLEAVVDHTPERTDEETPDGDSLPPGILKAAMTTELQIPNADGMVRQDSGKGSAVGNPRIKVGPQRVGRANKMGRVAYWQNNGWTLKGHKPGKKVVRTIPGKHFLEAAFDEAADRAVDVLVDSLWSDLFNANEGVGPEFNSHDVEFD